MEAVTFFKENGKLDFDAIDNVISSRAQDGYVVKKTFEDKSLFIIYFEWPE